MNIFNNLYWVVLIHDENQIVIKFFTKCVKLLISFEYVKLKPDYC